MKTLQKINLLIITSVMMVAVTMSSSDSLSAKTVKTQKTTLAPASSNNCQVKQQEFKRLYLELQAKYLNYEGKDTTFDSKGNIVLVPHKEGTPYEGKEFEEAIFKEYLNSVSKVAKLFQDEKFRPELSKSNEKLVDFLKAIDGNPDAFIEDKNNDINNIVEMLYQESNKKYKSGQNTKYAMTERDKYLLKKLVTHAQDRICSVDHYKNTKTKTKYFSTTQLHQQMNGPINRIIYAIREAKITDKQRIVLYEPDELMVNGKEAVHSAIKAHINDIAKFVKENKACVARIKDLKFIQKNIQPCNYQRFIDSLQKAPSEFSELESILHFINANDHFFGYKKKDAETDLDPEILEMRTRLRLRDENGVDVLNALGCSKGQNEKGQEAIFLRNLPSKLGTDEPDTSIIECFDAKSNHQLDAQACQKLIKVEADYIGRGLVVKTVDDENSGKFKFSIKDKPECSQVINNDLTGPNPDLLTDDNKPNEDANKCPDGQTRDANNNCVPVSAELCKEQGLILNPEKTGCIKDPNANTCPGGKDCPNTTTPPLDNVVNQCDPKCTKGFICDEVTNQCLKDPQTDRTCPDKQEWKANEDGKGGQCVDKPADNNNDDEAKCKEKMKKWAQQMIDEGEGASKKNGYKQKFEWKDGKCIETPDERKPKKETAAAPIEKLNLVDGPAPARFTPIQIPQRRFYVLPGMP